MLSLGLVGCSAALWSQDSALSSRSTAIDRADSRAEREAEQLVSLSADRILGMLRQEPGLLLQVKKAVVRKAFEQGRILDSKDLTDEALFRLLREDEGIRVLATREIEDRSYIRAKPTREELARNLPCRQPLLAGSEALARQSDQSQEDAYWLKHYSDLDCYLTQFLPYGAAQSLYWHPQAAPARQSAPPPSYFEQPSPQPHQGLQPSPERTYPPEMAPPQTSPQDYRRQLEFTDLQPQNYFDMDGGEGEGASIQPTEIAGLLHASQAGALPSASGIDTGSSAAGDWRRTPSAGGLSSGSLSLGDLSSSNLSGSWSPGMNSSAAGRATEEMAAARFENQSGSGQRWFSPPKIALRPQLRHQTNPYADVPSLYDLYAQYAQRSPRLERFGEEIFRNGTGNLDQLPMDLPAGPDYVVGPGDGLTISLSGGLAQRLQRVVDREGRLALPEVGGVEVAGRSLGEVQRLVQSSLRAQFTGIEADVSLSRIRTVRVYVVGDVERPGAYDVSSLSTPLNALYSAGGPTAGGSLRVLRHYRGPQLIQELDGYDLLLHGIRQDLQRLEAGDTLEVPPLRGEVAVEGMVRRPALYELHGEKNLAEVLELAGGVLPSGTLRHVDVERVESHARRTMLRLDIPESDSDAGVAEALENFAVQDGDTIKITPILPYAFKTVYLDGHVSRPGKFAYREGMRVSDLIKSYDDLLPEPSTTHAEIIRLSQPDYAPVVLAFNLGDALAGQSPGKSEGQNSGRSEDPVLEDPVLQPFDTVRVFGRFDFEDPPVVTVTGEVRDPGDHLTNGAAHLRDAIYLAGGATPNALLEDAQVFRKSSDGKLQVLGVNLAKALAGDPKDNIALDPRDRVLIYRDLNKLDPPTVTIAGEVARPGKYPLAEDMTAAELVRVAGGFKRGAYTETADLTRYELEQGAKMVSEHAVVPIAAALAHQPDADVRLRDGDLLTIEQLSGWKDVGATITLTGEVVHPGTYGIEAGERLSSVVARAGGFRPEAYPYGAVFERQQIRELEEKNRAELILRVQAEAANTAATPEQNAQDTLSKQAAVEQFQQTLHKLIDTPPEGRLVLHISARMQRWANTSADIKVRAGDTLYVPSRPGVVLVDGAVYNPTGITFRSGKNAEWYLRQAGGPTQTANKRAVFVIRADGSVVSGASGLFSGGVENTGMQPGDMVVVPEKVISVSRTWQNTVQTAQIFSAVAIAVEAARSF